MDRRASGPGTGYIYDTHGRIAVTAWYGRGKHARRCHRSLASAPGSEIAAAETSAPKDAEGIEP